MLKINAIINDEETNIDLTLHENGKCIFFGFSYREEDKRTWTRVMITPPFEEKRSATNHMGWHGAYRRLLGDAFGLIRTNKELKS